MGITVQTYGGTVYYDVPYHCVLRDGDATNPTVIELDYTSYSSILDTPGIGDWVETDDQVAVQIDALNGSGTVVATAVATDYVGAAAGMRTFTFLPESPVEVASFRISAVPDFTQGVPDVPPDIFDRTFRGKMTNLVPGTEILASGTFTIASTHGN